jgi:hypothetical protein
LELFVAQTIGQKYSVLAGIIVTGSSDPVVSQSIGRGRTSREEALDVRESRERRDKIFAGKKEKSKFLDEECRAQATPLARR